MAFIELHRESRSVFFNTTHIINFRAIDNDDHSKGSTLVVTSDTAAASRPALVPVDEMPYVILRKIKEAENP